MFMFPFFGKKNSTGSPAASPKIQNFCRDVTGRKCDISKMFNYTKWVGNIKKEKEKEKKLQGKERS